MRHHTPARAGFRTTDEHLFKSVDRDAKQEQAAAAKLNPALRRPGMQLWVVLVRGLLKQGLKCDFDDLAELASKHLDVRRITGLSGPSATASSRIKCR